MVSLQFNSSIDNSKLNLILDIVNNAANVSKCTQIVHELENHARKCEPEGKFGALYIIDAIVRLSRSKYRAEDMYSPLFAVNLPEITTALYLASVPEDKPKFSKILNGWKNDCIFTPTLLEPLLRLTTQQEFQSPLSNDYSNYRNPPTRAHIEPAYCNQQATPVIRNQPFSAPRQVIPNNIPPNGQVYHNANPYANQVNGVYLPNNHQQNAQLPPLQNSQDPRVRTNPRVNLPAPHQMHHPLHYMQHSPQQMHTPPQHQQSFTSATLHPMNRQAHIPTDTRHYPVEPPVTPYYAHPSSAPNYYPQHSHPNGDESSYRRRHISEAVPVVSSPVRSRSRTPPPRRVSFADNADAETRKKLGIPDSVANHVTLCSTTLWIGNLPVDCTKKDLTEIFSNYGTIHSIIFVESKNCAFICMKRREDAYKAYERLNINNPVKRLWKKFGDQIKLGWAPGKGLKSLPGYEEYWKFESGSAFLPYSTLLLNGKQILTEADLEAIGEGSTIDRQTLPTGQCAVSERFNNLNI